MFEVTNLRYEDKVDELVFLSNSIPQSTKTFPIFSINGELKIFKPLSKTKPYLTPFFAHSEVFNSYLINKYFDPNMPKYTLAICKGISSLFPKYYEQGTLVSFVNQKEEKVTSFFEYFKKNPDPAINIDNYVNYCMVWYEYVPFFQTKLFLDNPELGKQLAWQILISSFTVNYNFHYENAAFITKNDNVIRLCPPIDNEFSAMFIYADNMALQNKIIEDFEKSLWGQEFSEVKSNINFVITQYDEIAKEFSEILYRIIEDLKVIKLTSSTNFVFPFSSDDFEIGSARYKEKNIGKANLLEKLIPKVKVDEEKYLRCVLQNYIRVASCLKDYIDRELTRKKLINKK